MRDKVGGESVRHPGEKVPLFRLDVTLTVGQMQKRHQLLVLVLQVSRRVQVGCCSGKLPAYRTPAAVKQHVVQQRVVMLFRFCPALVIARVKLKEFATALTFDIANGTINHKPAQFGTDPFAYRVCVAWVEVPHDEAGTAKCGDECEY